MPPLKSLKGLHKLSNVHTTIKQFFHFFNAIFIFHSFSRVLRPPSQCEMPPVVRLRPSWPNWGGLWVGSWRLESVPAATPASLTLACWAPPSLPAPPLRIITSRLSTKSLSPCIILTTFHPPPLYSFHFTARKERAKRPKTCPIWFCSIKTALF